jgi:hypothetical protein
MGFFDFIAAPFKAIGSGLSTVVKTVGSGLSKVYNAAIKPVGEFIYNKALKPVYNKVLKPVFNGVVKPVFDGGMKVFNKSIDAGTKMMDLGVSTATGFSKILTNPIMLIGGGILAIVVLTKVA